MQAMVLENAKDLHLRDVPVPALGEHDVLVRVRACGIYGSDVHGYDGSTGRRIPPLIMGHEASGVVEETGSAVRRFREGDRVTFDSTVSCGHCQFCLKGEVNLCDTRQVLGCPAATTAATARLLSSSPCRNTSCIDYPMILLLRKQP